MEIKIATENEIKYCYNILNQDKKDLSKNIAEQIKNGYQVAYVIKDEKIICVLGFKISQKSTWGKHIYIEDFVIIKNEYSQKASKALLDFLKIYAKQQNCTSIHLDSNINRHEAHEFYLKENFQIDSQHFSFKIN